MFEVAQSPLIVFPAAENTWRYEDAHVSLYAILLDGLSMPCIRALASALNRKIDPGATRALNAVQKTLLPSLGTDPAFADPMKNVSDQRGLSSHRVRPEAKAMKAFDQFSRDLESCVAAFQLLKITLSKELGIDAERSRERQEALERLSKIGKPVGSGYSITGALAMQGKTVVRVEVGERHQIDGVDQSEVIILHFNDGSIASIDTLSNAKNLRCERHHPNEFRVDFRVQWVPPPK